MQDLSELINFIKLTHKIRGVKRAVTLEGNYRENDTEHQYQMALVAWYLIEKDNLKLDAYKCIGMSMVHDIVEAYAGDTIAFASGKEQAIQKEKEELAIKKLKEEWSTFNSFNDFIDEYEAQKTQESHFVYALDKLLPIINNYMYGGKVWKRLGITLDRVKEIKKGKVDVSESINNYYKYLLDVLEQHPEVFGKQN